MVYLLKCPSCGVELKSYTFTKQLTRSGNSLVITVTDEIKEVLGLEHGSIVQVNLTKLA